MKTPREILFERHRAAVPKLNKLRRETVDAEFPRRSSSVALLNWPALLWRELIWPCRRVWMGLAAVWILIVAANFSLRDNSQTAITESSSPEEIVTAWKQQQQLLTELIGPNETKAGLPAKRFSPQPSGRRQVEVSVT
ncbi:MAG TPA: hypothetical protein VMH30_12025 [Verrucomicrobiae bacterium]|nr:hypothetical protein [Verrucomicrobiae bacterium]